MIQLRKLAERLMPAEGSGAVRRVRYAAVGIALVGLIWTIVTLLNTRREDEKARIDVVTLRHAVSDLHLQVARQRSARPTLAPPALDEEVSVEGLVARVGDAARISGVRLAQSRAVLTPVSSQTPAVPPPAGAPVGAAPAPPVDLGGVEFHLTGSYASLQRMMRTLGESRSRFQIATLDVLRAGVVAGSNSAQLDIRLVCIL